HRGHDRVRPGAVDLAPAGVALRSGRQADARPADRGRPPADGPVWGAVADSPVGVTRRRVIPRRVGAGRQYEPMPEVGKSARTFLGVVRVSRCQNCGFGGFLAPRITSGTENTPGTR